MHSLETSADLEKAKTGLTTIMALVVELDEYLGTFTDSMRERLKEDARFSSPNASPDDTASLRRLIKEIEKFGITEKSFVPGKTDPRGETFAVCMLWRVRRRISHLKSVNKRLRRQIRDDGEDPVK